MKNVTLNSIKDFAKVSNNSDTLVSIKFVSLDVDTRMATIRVEYKSKDAKKPKSFIIEARATKELMYWFTYKRADYVDGKYQGTASTGFERFKKRAELQDKKLGEIEFSSLNGSEDYYQNPFKLIGSEKYNSFTLTLCNMPGHIRKEKVDPMGLEEPKVYFVLPRRRDNGAILKLPKKYYRRLEIKQAHV